VVHGNVVDEFHNNDGFTDTGSAKETNLSSLGVRRQKINDLDSSDENILGSSLFRESRGGAMEGGVLFGLLAEEDGSLLVDGFSNHIDDASQGIRTDRDLDRSASVDALLSTDETIGTFHSNRTDSVLSQMLGNLQDEALSARYDFHFQSVENLGEFLIELNIHNGSNDLGYLSSTPESSGAAIGTSASYKASKSIVKVSRSLTRIKGNKAIFFRIGY
jgi:hypothetical protein